MTAGLQAHAGEPLAGVMGWPIAHSLSPALHRFWLEKVGIEGDYVRLPVRPEDLKAALHGLAPLGYRGANITVPHKERALAFIDRISPRARRIGAVNIVSVHPSGALHGDNSDGAGFVDSLRAEIPDFDPAATAAVLLGAGGAARAIAAALLDAGIARLSIVNRSEARARALARDLDDRRLDAGASGDLDRHLPGCGLLINATSAGMDGHPPLAIDLAALPPSAIVHDIVYKPLVTPLLAAARARGLRTVDGLGMLIHQAVPAFEAFFGRKPPVGSGERAHLIARLGALHPS